MGIMCGLCGKSSIKLSVAPPVSTCNGRGMKFIVVELNGRAELFTFHFGGGQRSGHFRLLSKVWIDKTQATMNSRVHSVSHVIIKSNDRGSNRATNAYHTQEFESKYSIRFMFVIWILYVLWHHLHDLGWHEKCGVISPWTCIINVLYTKYYTRIWRVTQKSPSF